MLRIALLIALALPLAAQTNVGSARPPCGTTDPAQPRFLMFLPATLVSGVASTTISVPVCVRLGANLKLDMAAVGGPAIDATGSTPAPVPASTRWQVDSFVIPAGTPQNQVTLPLRLTRTPAQGAVLLVFFQASVYGASYSDSFQPTGADTRAVVLTLPQYRPFTTNDVVRFAYETTEP